MGKEEISSGSTYDQIQDFNERYQLGVRLPKNGRNRLKKEDAYKAVIAKYDEKHSSGSLPSTGQGDRLPLSNPSSLDPKTPLGFFRSPNDPVICDSTDDGLASLKQTLQTMSLDDLEKRVLALEERQAYISLEIALGKLILRSRRIDLLKAKKSENFAAPGEEQKIIVLSWNLWACQSWDQLFETPELVQELFDLFKLADFIALQELPSKTRKKARYSILQSILEKADLTLLEPENSNGNALAFRRSKWVHVPTNALENEHTPVGTLNYTYQLSSSNRFSTSQTAFFKSNQGEFEEVKIGITSLHLGFTERSSRESKAAEGTQPKPESTEPTQPKPESAEPTRPKRAVTDQRFKELSGLVQYLRDKTSILPLTEEKSELRSFSILAGDFNLPPTDLDVKGLVSSASPCITALYDCKYTTSGGESYDHFLLHSHQTFSTFWEVSQRTYSFNQQSDIFNPKKATDPLLSNHHPVCLKLVLKKPKNE